MDRISHGEVVEVYVEKAEKWLSASVSYHSNNHILRVQFEKDQPNMIPLLGATIVPIPQVHGRNRVMGVYAKGSERSWELAFSSQPLYDIWKNVLGTAAEYSGKISCAGYLMWRWAGAEEWRTSYAAVERAMFCAYSDSTMEQSQNCLSIALVGCKVKVPEDISEAKTFGLTPLGGGKMVEVAVHNSKEFDEWISAIYGAVTDKSPAEKNSKLRVNLAEEIVDQNDLERAGRSMRVRNMVSSNLIETVDMSGYLLKLGAKVKSWKKRLFTLHANGSLTYSGPDKFGVMEVLGEICLFGATIRTVPASEYDGRAHLFGIFPADGGRTFIMQSASHADTERWVIAMNSYRDKYTPTSEECIFEGYMRKLGEFVPTWKERYFRLYSTHPRLEYYKNERERRMLGSVNLDRKCRLQIEPDQDDVRFVWSLFATEACRNYFFSCNCKNDRRDWMGQVGGLWSRGTNVNNPNSAPGSSPSPPDSPRATDLLEGEDFEMEREPEFLTGWLLKLGEVVKNWKRRWFVLSVRARKLKYYDKETDKKPCGEIPLLRGALVKQLGLLDSRDYCFSVSAVGNKRTYILQASSDQDRTQWMESITKVAQKGTVV